MVSKLELEEKMIKEVREAHYRTHFNKINIIKDLTLEIAKLDSFINLLVCRMKSAEEDESIMNYLVLENKYRAKRYKLQEQLKELENGE